MSFLRAIVSIWITEDRRWIDGCNDPREFVSCDWYEAREMTDSLIGEGLLRLKPSPRDYEDNMMVQPTTKGLFEAIS